MSDMARRTEIDDRFFFKDAPAVIVVVAKSQVNGALAASNMELAAQAHGLGVLYSGFFALVARLSPALRRELGLARGDKAVTALVVGHPAVTYRRTAPKEPANVRYLWARAACGGSVSVPQYVINKVAFCGRMVSTTNVAA